VKNIRYFRIRRFVSWDKDFHPVLGVTDDMDCLLRRIPAVPLMAWQNHFRNGQTRMRALEFGRHECAFVTERRRVNGNPGNLPAAKSQWLQGPARAHECFGAAWSSGKEEEPMSPGRPAAERAERWKGYED
jgi:hypothetical protein